MRARLQLKQPVLDLLWPFLPRFFTWPSSDPALRTSAGDLLRGPLGVNELWLEIDILIVVGDASNGLL